MPVYQYTVHFDTTGAVRTGTSEAVNQDILKKRLQEQGFAVSDMKQTSCGQEEECRAADILAASEA